MNGEDHNCCLLGGRHGVPFPLPYPIISGELHQDKVEDALSQSLTEAPLLSPPSQLTTVPGQGGEEYLNEAGD